MPNCIICGQEATARLLTCESGHQKGHVLHAEICTACGFVRLPENTEDYAEVRSGGHVEDLERLRGGNDARPGREFHMANLGREILGINQGLALFFGAGLNKDNALFKAQHHEFDVKVSDITNLGNLDNFIALDAPIKANIIVASEVIEHFLNPQDEFEKLFVKIHDDGILLASTNIYDGGIIQKQTYPFYPGHCSYYTPESLALIAAQNGVFVDFRLPLIALGRGGPRKRYVIFFKNLYIYTLISIYFGKHALAPSEPE